MTSRTLHAPPDVAAIAARVPATPPGIPDHRDEIAAAVAAIVERFHPERIILFGSRARGTPRPDSDADLMVIADPPPSLGDLLDAVIRQRYRVRIGTQVRTPDRIRVGLAEGDFFILDIMTEGVSLFEQPAGVRAGYERETVQPAADQPFGLKLSTRDWLRRASGDLAAAAHLADDSDDKGLTGCYHAQEAAKGYFKALLQERGVRFFRGHDLADLVQLAHPLVPAIDHIRPELRWLSRYTLDVCYPNSTIQDGDAPAALRIARDVRGVVHKALGVAGNDRE